VITGVAVYAPLAIFGYSHFVRGGAVFAGVAAMACAIGGSYRFWPAACHGWFEKCCDETG
jgi:hypothetical protein